MAISILTEINQLTNQYSPIEVDSYKDHTMTKRMLAELNQKINTVINALFEGKSKVSEEEFIQIIETNIPLLNVTKYKINIESTLRQKIHMVVVFKFIRVYEYTVQKYGPAIHKPTVWDIYATFRSGDIEFCKWVIKEFNIDINAAQQNIRLIFLALLKDDIIALETLLNLGVDLSVEDNVGCTPLCRALKDLSVYSLQPGRDVDKIKQAVELLVRHGAQRDINWEQGFLKSSIRFYAVSKKPVLLSEEGFITKVKDHVALLGDSIDRNDIAGEFKAHLYQFIEKKNDKIVHYILDEWDLSNVQEKDGSKPFDLLKCFFKAAENENQQICEKLVEKFQDEWDRSGSHSVMYGLNNMNVTSCFYNAAKRGDQLICQRLVEKFHFDLNRITKNYLGAYVWGSSVYSDHTPIIDATLKGNYQLLEILLNLDADPNLGYEVIPVYYLNLKFDSRKSALDIARDRQDERAIALLEKHGALPYADQPGTASCTIS